jgi:hypothetical protein
MSPKQAGECTRANSMAHVRSIFCDCLETPAVITMGSMFSNASASSGIDDDLKPRTPNSKENEITIKKLERQEANMKIFAQGFSNSRAFSEGVEIEYMFCLCEMTKKDHPEKKVDPTKPLVELSLYERLISAHHCIRMIYMVIVEEKPQFRSFWIDLRTVEREGTTQTELHVLRDPNNTKIFKYDTNGYYKAKLYLRDILGIHFIVIT